MFSHGPSSLQEFVKDAGSYSKKMVDDLLDQITGGDHSRMLFQLRQVGAPCWPPCWAPTALGSCHWATAVGEPIQTDVVLASCSFLILFLFSFFFFLING